MAIVGPHRVARVVGRVAFVDNAKYASEAIDQEVITAAAADVVQQRLAHPLQQVVLTGLERGLQAFSGMVDDSGRVGAPLAAGPFRGVIYKGDISSRAV